jgi:hypothetical protein
LLQLSTEIFNRRKKSIITRARNGILKLISELNYKICRENWCNAEYILYIATCRTGFGPKVVPISHRNHSSFFYETSEGMRVKQKYGFAVLPVNSLSVRLLYLVFHVSEDG